MAIIIVAAGNSGLRACPDVSGLRKCQTARVDPAAAILVVDDHDGFRVFARRMLEAAGFTVAEAAIPGGCTPDTLSSDIHVFSGNSPSVPFLPNVMSKFMAMGFTLEQVVAMATIAPAKIINRAPKIGTLQLGAPGDVSIMELVEGPVTFVDTRNNMRDGKAYLKPVQTVINGVPFGRPYQSPFAVR